MLSFGSNLMTANKAVSLAALIWWIVWLWRDEPGTQETATETAPEQRES
jgi:hypothetical protein